MDKIENKIVSYFLEEFGRNNLTSIRLKPIELKYKEQLDFINNRLRHRILKPVNAYEYFPNFETLVQANSPYKVNLVKDIDVIYLYLREVYQDPNLDEVSTTLNAVLQNVDLTKERLCECFYYLADTLFTSYATDAENKQIVFNMDREFFLRQEFIQYNSFSGYLEQTKSSWQKMELQEKTTLRKLTPAQIDVETTQRNASKLWALYPSKRVAQIIREHKEDLLKGCKHQKCADSTLRTRIAHLHPNPKNSKGGRDKKPKDKSTSSMSDLLKKSNKLIKLTGV
ncbi:hypothetical protein [Bathymodiolus septemdierum thioautotrophic gill symbiont]|uniref:Uncharacterized protein n=1 Tax=endosymbiont of Bathymodiolus septemdierum str. Myojin knoll TaxID=1303921 RepID=A0A0P0URC4_9GAMM|nr:hypothetical protein [Bathymodiolus septemdierum thioautotrophic gill symbiont]BAS67781.1 hypothetical protein BSEPE_0788 [endosymbiont of Bathymodiolus septemdierum str. Myojin knoll]